MKRFIEGQDRHQRILLPEQLEDYVADSHPVRVVDVSVNELDLAQMGFEGTMPAQTGRPAYHPEVLLKIYIYRYLNRLQSSRRLEREAQRNVELRWLTGHLTPDFKTIANFRKDNGRTISNVCRQFVVLCQRRVTRWEHEEALDAMQERLERTPEAMRIRRRTVEHPFGNIKAWMGATHFLTRTKARVSTEMSLHVLAYNMKRMINILGVGALMKVMSA